MTIIHIISGKNYVAEYATKLSVPIIALCIDITIKN